MLFYSRNQIPFSLADITQGTLLTINFISYIVLTLCGDKFFMALDEGCFDVEIIAVILFKQLKIMV